MSKLPAFATASCFLRARSCATSATSAVASACPIAIDTVAETSISLVWPATTAPGPYRVQYGPAGAPLTSLRSTFRPAVTLRNLRPGVKYDVRVSPDVGAAAFQTVGMAADAVAGGGDDAAAAAVVEELPLTELSRLQVLVGKIVECEQHPDADTLYVEKVDCGEAEPRTIVSGLVKYVNKEDLVGRTVLCLANLKPRAMRGVTSHGMLLCASNEDHTQVDPLTAPEGAAVGELVKFEGHRSAPMESGNRASKAFDRVAAELKTDSDGIAMYQDVKFQTSAGPCYSPAKLEGSVS
jgi:methionine--tRNA ligase beta chain